MPEDRPSTAPNGPIRHAFFTRQTPLRLTKNVSNSADFNAVYVEEIEAALDQMVDKCNVTYFKHAKERIESGAAKSFREASRQMAAETGESFPAVETRVHRGKKKIQQSAVHETEKTAVRSRIQKGQKKVAPRDPATGAWAIVNCKRCGEPGLEGSGCLNPECKPNKKKPVKGNAF